MRLRRRRRRKSRSSAAAGSRQVLARVSTPVACTQRAAALLHTAHAARVPCRLLRSEEAAESSVQHVGDRGWQAHSSYTVRATHLVRTRTHAHSVCKCALWIDCMACDSQARHRLVW